MHKNHLSAPRRLVRVLLVLLLLAQTACINEGSPTILPPVKPSAQKKHLSGLDDFSAGSDFKKRSLTKDLLEKLNPDKTSKNKYARLLKRMKSKLKFSTEKLFMGLKSDLEAIIDKEEQIEIAFETGANPFSVIMAYATWYSFYKKTKISDKLVKALCKKGADVNTRLEFILKNNSGKLRYNMSIIGLAVVKKTDVEVQIALSKQQPNVNARQEFYFEDNEGQQKGNYDMSTMGLALYLASPQVQRALIEQNANAKQILEFEDRKYQQKMSYNMSTMGLAIDKKAPPEVQQALGQQPQDVNSRQIFILKCSKSQQETNYNMSTMGLALYLAPPQVRRALSKQNPDVNAKQTLEFKDGKDHTEEKYNMSTMGLALYLARSEVQLALSKQQPNVDAKQTLEFKNGKDQIEEIYNMSTMGLALHLAPFQVQQALRKQNPNVNARQNLVLKNGNYHTEISYNIPKIGPLEDRTAFQAVKKALDKQLQNVNIRKKPQ